MFLLQHAQMLETLGSPLALFGIIIGAIISGFFLQRACVMMGIFNADYSKCFFVSLVGIVADYGVAWLVYVEGYIGGFIGVILNLFINTAILVGFFKIGWFRAFMLYIFMKIISLVIGCLCCCGINRRFPSF